jgi:feruloyl esterase
MRYLVLVIALSGPLFATVPCENLAKLALPRATVTLAQPVAAGQLTLPAGAVPTFPGFPAPNFGNLPAFCRVAATLTPSSDSDIKIEIWMPASGWNHKLESVGNGAWAGTIGYRDLASAVTAGYAAASTDTGHTGNTATFVVGHPEKLADFAYRAIHEMTIAAKAITSAYYGNGLQRAYFNGCSTGGRQALAEAQRFPADYDGIIAGAAANYPTHLQGAQVWTAQVSNQDPAGHIPPSKYALIHNAALETCDALDGVKDRVLEDPTRCHFDPQVLLCKNGDEPTCLTAAQVEVARKTYAGPGPSLFPGLERGSELGWTNLSSPKPMALAQETYKYLVFHDPNWDYLTFDPARDVALADKVAGPIMNSTDPNLSPFFQHGGKLLMYHGWADPGIAPRNSVNYYKSVVDTVGTAKAADSIRLFMVPGMGHCAGGDGTDDFDKIGTLAQWVEKSQPPDRIPAAHRAKGVVDRTRPLCPFPQVAQYRGTGSTDDAASFVCQAP